MDATFSKQIDIHLEMTLAEALWLRGYMQNPRLDTVIEDPAVKNRRETLFKVLDNIIEVADKAEPNHG